MPNLSTFLTNRLTLNVYAYYQKEKDRGHLSSISPILTWQWRRVTLTARYILNNRGDSRTITGSICALPGSSQHPAALLVREGNGC